MKDGRCQSNAISCGTMVSQCREFWARALYLLEMEQDINEVESKTLHGFCHVFCMAALFHISDFVAAEFGATMTDQVACSAVISCCEQGEEWRQALAVLLQMQDGYGQIGSEVKSLCGMKLYDSTNLRVGLIQRMIGLTEMHVAKAALTGNFLQGENPFGKRNCN